MMKKIIKSMFLMMVITVLLVGCGSAKGTKEPDKVDQAGAKTDGTTKEGNKPGAIDYDKYKAIGDIMEIDGQKVSLLSGDIMEDFEDVEGLDVCYIGETIGLIKTAKGFKAEKIITDKRMRYTSMGMLIERVEGKIVGLDDKEMTVATEEGDITIALAEPIEHKIGDDVIVDYLTADNKNIFAIYNKAHGLELIVDRIERTDNGIMILHTKNDEDSLYDVYVLSGTDVDFNLSELKKEDRIMVYAQVIRESYPAQVDADMISLLKK